MPALSESLKRNAKKSKKQKAVVWEGPDGKGPNGGITFSLLSRFLVCRERFRLLVSEGLRPADQFNHRIEYGQMWHLCEESLANDEDKDQREGVLRKYAVRLMKKYPLHREQIGRYHRAALELFPLYMGYWFKHPDVKQRTPLLQERAFDVPYELPSGRVIRLRGKWDSVDRIGRGKGASIYLQENKTKGDLREEKLREQLASGFDLQTMLYLIALSEYQQHNDKGENPLLAEPIAGVWYNVVRRPFSGVGPSKPLKGSKNKSPESEEQFIKRLGEAVAAEPGKWFMRWRVEVTLADLERFCRECLDPILEQLCDWWSVTERGTKPWTDVAAHCHWRAPTGVYNVLLEGGSSDLDAYLNDGSTLGLERTGNLFPELSDA